MKPEKQIFIKACLLPDDITGKWGSLTNKCRYCGKVVKEDDAEITYSYWNAFWFMCHKQCKDNGYKAEAVECQEIDADCNDCKDFKRQDGTKGICLKTGKDVVASANFCSNKPCFEHRKKDDING